MADAHPPASPQVICAGILVADLFVPPLAALPTAGQLLATDDFLLDTGGCAANVATVLARLGVRAAAVGKVGRDFFGDFVAADLNKKGVDTTGVLRSGGQGTSKTVILPVVGEDRRFIHTFGANANFRASDIDLAAYPAASVLYVGGYMVMPALAPAELAAVFSSARSAGMRTVLDVVVAAGRAASSMEALDAVLPHVDLFMPNDDEAGQLTGETDPVRQARRFLAAGCGAVIVTRGANGVVYVDACQAVTASAYPIEYVDGSGSGDAFAAGCIAAMLEGRAPVDMLPFASAVGASACRMLGCTTGVFTRAEADSFVAGHRINIEEAPAS